MADEADRLRLTVIGAAYVVCAAVLAAGTGICYSVGQSEDIEPGATGGVTIVLGALAVLALVVGTRKIAGDPHRQD